MLELHEGPASNHENMEGSFPQAADIITAGVDALLEEGEKNSLQAGNSLRAVLSQSS